ncbi:Nucleic acid-binding OB-fold [Trinorchestia longiramus]|nr:Nucleic acid-binding OB-fold [Trinorchestia longiramus]
MMYGVPHTKVYIHQLKFDKDQQSCSVNGYNVSHIDLLGTVVSRTIRDHFHVYGIDDGTGTIPCVKFLSERHPFPDHKVKNAVPEIQELYQASISALDYVPKLGDCLHIKGKPSFSKGNPRIIINKLRIVEDCNEWWFRVLELKATRHAAARIIKK